MVIFCSADPSSLIHGDFSEMVRAFGGMNLSGKLAGFVSLGDNDSSGLFRKALLDTNISMFKETLSVDRLKGESEKLRTWIDKYYEKHRGCTYE
jgi:hypothetical protein